MGLHEDGFDNAGDCYHRIIVLGQDEPLHAFGDITGHRFCQVESLYESELERAQTRRYPSCFIIDGPIFDPKSWAGPKNDGFWTGTSMLLKENS